MRRYRTVILVLVFGVVPIGAALVLGVTVILPSLQQTEVPAEQVVIVEEAVVPPEPVLVRVALTAAGPLSPGMLLTAGDLVLEEVSDELVPLPEARYVYVDRIEYVDGIEENADTGMVDGLRGYAVRRTVTTGEPVTWEAVVSPDDAQFLATVLEAGQVAVSVPVSLANQQAKLVSPGNRVDVLLVIEQTGELLVRTIVENVRVIAVNSHVIAEEDVRVGVHPGRTEDGASSENSADARPEVTTVTLEVTPVQGEHLALGAYEGQLSLAIRPHDRAPVRSTASAQNLRSVLRLPEPEPEAASPATQPLALPHPSRVNLTMGTFHDEALPVAAGGIQPYTYALTCAGGSLPAGMGFAPATRRFAGTPGARFRDSCAYAVADGSEPAATVSVPIEVEVTAVAPQPLELPHPSRVSLTMGTFHDEALPVAAGGVQPYTYALTCAGGSLPSGMGFAPATRRFAGTPDARFRDSCTYSVGDSSEAAAAVAVPVEVEVTAAPIPVPIEVEMTDVAPQPLALPHPSRVNLTMGTFHDAALPVAAGGVQPYTYALTCAGGSLPSGMGFAPATRRFAGTPEARFRDSCAYSVADSSESAATVAVPVEVEVAGVAPQPLALPHPSRVNLSTGTFHDEALPVATGGVQPYTYALTCAGGSLPSGMGFAPATRRFAGTPEARFRDSCSYSVADSSESAATVAVPVEVEVAGMADVPLPTSVSVRVIRGTSEEQVLFDDDGGGPGLAEEAVADDIDPSGDFTGTEPETPSVRTP